jgi:hypothetical protein
MGEPVAAATRARRSSRSVLNLGVADITDEWGVATSGMADGLRLLRDECGVLVERWLPYKTMLVTLAATWSFVAAGKGPEVGERRAKLRRWFWCSTFSGTYDNSSNSTAEADYLALQAWLTGGDTPAVVSAFDFDVARLRDVTPRQRALYQSTMALLMRGGPRDFYDGAPLTRTIIEGRAVDDHHIFPRAWLKTSGLDHVPDSILNHTLIGKTTNILIGGRAPSIYLAEMHDALKDELASILLSHGLPPHPEGPLITDRFEDFLRWRLDHLAGLLASVTAG